METPQNKRKNVLLIGERDCQAEMPKPSKLILARRDFTGLQDLPGR
jgi:hypothetical protein